MRLAAFVLFGCIGLAGACHKSAVDKPCIARFSSPMVQGAGPTYATYTFDVTGLRSDQIKAMIDQGVAGTGAVQVSAVVGNPRPAMEKFMSTPVDARGSMLLADRTYLRIRPAQSTTMDAARERGCRAEGGGVRMIAIQYEWRHRG